jgi:hypothetical protein
MVVTAVAVATASHCTAPHATDPWLAGSASRTVVAIFGDAYAQARRPPIADAASAVVPRAFTFCSNNCTAAHTWRIVPPTDHRSLAIVVGFEFGVAVEVTASTSSYRGGRISPRTRPREAVPATWSQPVAVTPEIGKRVACIFVGQLALSPVVAIISINLTCFASTKAIFEFQRDTTPFRRGGGIIAIHLTNTKIGVSADTGNCHAAIAHERSFADGPWLTARRESEVATQP